MKDTKERLLKLLEDKRGEFLSGEEAADKLGVSRAAVWKAVNGLKADGYEIDGVRNKGYKISETSDVLSASGISKYLGAACRNLSVEVIPETVSTNTLLREKAEKGAADGTVIIANRQTGGKGRRGRSFFSPSDTGVYLSILLRPDESAPKDAVKLTTLAAVAACEAIEAVAEKPASVKWVNDVFADGKKVAGILTEASFGLETGLLDYAVLGIGFNAYVPADGFPKELRNIAGAVFSERIPDGKNRLAAGFLNRFANYYNGGKVKNYAEEYRKRSFILGKEIYVISGDSRTPAVAVAVDDECRLSVRYKDGSTALLSSGEVSVKPV